MFSDYGNTYNCRIKIYSADDSKNFSHVDVDIHSTYAISRRTFNPYYSSRGGESESTDNEGIRRTNVNISLPRTRSGLKGEPIILAMKQELQSLLGWGSRGRAKSPDEFQLAFTFPEISGLAILISKNKPYNHLMGSRITKKNLMMNLSRLLYKSCFTKDSVKLLVSLYSMIELPENITYVLENRTPYWYFNKETREKLEVRLNTMLIDDNECAIEISDGIWAPISVKDLDIFINYFYHGHTRSKKWAYASPKKLWTLLMGSSPSTSQEKLMMEFLSQNRTQDLIENRAKELMQSLTVKYPDRIRIIEKVGKKDSKSQYTIMLVRGQLCDWIIVDSAYKTQIQKVKTYVYIKEDFLEDEEESKSRAWRDKINFSKGMLRGPICIDNIHDNSSVGDQYAARALALLNDKVTVNLVNTIKRYIPKSILEGDESRIEEFDELSADSNWDVII